MKPNKLTLHIDEPCTENWNTMNPQEKGRFCSSCSKIVVDFTVMTENQIIDFFKNYTGEVCGRMYEHQLEYTYTLNVPGKQAKATYFIHFALAGLLTLALTNGYAEINTPVTEQSIPVHEEKEDHPASGNGDDPRSISGKIKVHGEDSNVNGIKVTLQETGQSMVTDSTGAFQFVLPENYKGKQVNLRFSHKGYEDVHTISIKQLPLTNLLIRLYHSEHIKMGKVAPRY